MSLESDEQSALPSGLLAVLGHPVAHSLSPLMHTAALDALLLGDRVRYVARDVAPSALPSAVAELREGRLLGANVTLPHKRAVMSLCDEIEPDAAAIGAVNTLVRDPRGRVVGSNTDAPGLARALAESGLEVLGKVALVVGAGGAARASVVAIARAGADRVFVAARRRGEANRLVQELGPVLPDVALGALDLDPLAIEQHAAEFCLVVQATSATLDPQTGAALAGRLPFARMKRDAVVMDLVYRPRRTAVLRAAEGAGLQTLEGDGMLVHQGALSLERWLGVRAPISAMRAAVRAALAV